MSIKPSLADESSYFDNNFMEFTSIEKFLIVTWIEKTEVFLEVTEYLLSSHACPKYFPVMYSYCLCAT